MPCPLWSSSTSKASYTPALGVSRTVSFLVDPVGQQDLGDRFQQVRLGELRLRD
jgi:hypothetical protein